jgi:hypothetical protein
MATRSVLLLATNKQKYLDFALNCAKSINIHNPGMPVYIATNIAAQQGYPGVQFVPVSDDQARLNIGTKVYLDQFIQTDETLFIDSDCLCYGNLNPVFDACQGHDVTVVGRLISRMEEWGPKSAAHGMENFGTDKFIIYNGGFYYIKKSITTTKIFNKARELFGNYDKYAFGRIQNGWENEEQVFAIAMVLHNQTPLKDDGKLMTDLYTDRRPRKLNVLTGARVLRNKGPHLTEARDRYPATFSPVILHFGGNNIGSYPYIAQSLLLKLHNWGLPVFLSSFITFVCMDIPFKTYHFIRRISKI